ncbi:hypothetical protein P154DRAFT_329430 [Amniculicola lignicola CBS 123094]|uniref:Homeobox domain-containing protein n=1 Tax=Amniculicola lignicola CBS 123094 TaxID=1392246 RepID=A0A6A5W401_9PLEO|nr:hypothetical protein P154DRAFT_329430 [Amniculicola lignicola CBS 123094]
MEYLTLQDVPLRHHFPRSMASSEDHRGVDTTGSLPGLAAVCAQASFLLPRSECLLPPPPPPPPLSLHPQPMAGASSTFSTSLSAASSPPITLPANPRRPGPPYLCPTSQNTASSVRRIMIPPPVAAPAPDRPPRRVDSKAGPEPNIDSETQNHHLRNSPPFQPGEQRSSSTSLPSFSQLLQNVREPSPPKTPSRRNADTDSSPVMKPPHQPQFEDVSWQDGKRRRVDYGDPDVSQRPVASSERTMYDARRPSVIDPALSSTYSSPRAHLSVAMAPSAADRHHRPSLPYPPPPPGPPAHARHQSSPIPQGHAGYQFQQHPPPPSVMIAQNSYAHAPMHAAPFDHRRPSYYEQHPVPQLAHAYGRPPHESYYPREAYPTHPPHGYGQEIYHQPPQPYNSYTFQSTMGADQNAFNRKRRGNLPKEATGILKAWFQAHRDSPYPTEDEKLALCNQTNLSINQISNWFINARRRSAPKEQRDGANDVSS